MTAHLQQGASGAESKTAGQAAYDAVMGEPLRFYGTDPRAADIAELFRNDMALNAREAVDAALASRADGAGVTAGDLGTLAVPDGWMLVPEEATGAMWAAGQEADANPGDSYGAVWRAMVDACPRAPVLLSPAPAAGQAGAGPDSLRALSEASIGHDLRERIFKALAAYHMQKTQQQFLTNQVSYRLTREAAFVAEALLATHPAGQSAGSGPIAVVQSLRDADWSGASIGNKLLIVAAIDALEVLTAHQRVTAERDEARAKQEHADELRLRWQKQVQKWASERDEALQRSLDNFDRASRAEAALATATAEAASLRAELEAKDRALKAKAEEQVAYWRERQRAEKSPEDGISEDGETYTPIGDVAAWQGGYCNGRMSEADWWLKTLQHWPNEAARAATAREGIK